METETIIPTEEPTPVETPIPTETVEIVGVSEDLFIVRMNSIENLLVGQIVSSALIFACALTILIMGFFHVR